MRVVVPPDRPGPAALEDLYDPGEKPSLRLGFVVGVDGTVVVDGSSMPLRTPSDSAAFRALRAVADAVVVGAGTAREEDYAPVRLTEAGAAWRVRTGRPARVPLVLLSRSARLDPAARAFRAGNAVVVTCEAADRGARDALARVADVVVCGDDDVDLPAAVSELRRRGLSRLLCEGGPRLAHGLLEAGLVDELCLTVAPVVAGGPALLPEPLEGPARLELVHVVDGGDGALLCRWALSGRRGGRAPG